MKILFLGGTAFLGRAMVENALSRDHQVTIFHRGNTNPGIFPQAQELLGNREQDLYLLDGQTWDAVIDTSGYTPHAVQLAAQKLVSMTGLYVFISSISVYADLSRPGATEHSAVKELDGEPSDEVTPETYGPLKAMCEDIVQDLFPERSLIIRPGLIVGPYDTTDRFTYWVWRIASGSQILLPDIPHNSVQFIDVRDLAAWVIHMLEEHSTGVYHATGPKTPLSMKELFDSCRLVTQSNARFTWISEQFLLQHQVEPWTDLPLWVPSSEPDSPGFFAVDCRQAQSKGLTYRPLQETIQDTYEWSQTRDQDYTWQTGLTREREEEIITLWEAEHADE